MQVRIGRSNAWEYASLCDAQLAEAGTDNVVSNAKEVSSCLANSRDCLSGTSHLWLGRIAKHVSLGTSEHRSRRMRMMMMMWSF